MKSVLLLLDASKGFVLFALLICKPVSVFFIYSLCLQDSQPVCRSWKIYARPQWGDKGKDKALQILREQLTQGDGHKLQEDIPLPKGCLECKVPEQVLFSLFEWRLILSVSSVSYSS